MLNGSLVIDFFKMTYQFYTIGGKLKREDSGSKLTAEGSKLIRALK